MQCILGSVLHAALFRVKCGLLGSEAGKGRPLDFDAKTVYFITIVDLKLDLCSLLAKLCTKS